MSWFARSIANTLNFDDNDDEEDSDVGDDNNKNEEKISTQKNDEEFNQPAATDSPRGVKEDISVLTKTLTRHFWGVASFLAPPPPSDSDHSLSSDREVSEAEGISGIRSDFAEIGGRFRSGISKLSSNIAVSEITKMASSLLQLGPEDDDYDPESGSAVGVTDDVVAFVKDIAMHPETWLDFPLPVDDDDDEDFDLSDAQQEHALAVERLAPSLAALRIEICQDYMTESSFWKIYFVLLHPRLTTHDAELLSTPAIVKARALLTYELQNRSKSKLEQEWSRSDTSDSKDISNAPPEEHLSVPSCPRSESVPLETTASTLSADLETEKHTIPSHEIQIIDKSIIEEGPTNCTKVVEAKDKDEDDDGDDWLKEASTEEPVASGTTVPIENDEDVSFSDLEEDDGDDVATSDKRVTYCSDSSTRDSRDWVQLGRSSADSAKDIDSDSIERGGSGQVNLHNSETKESNDWLDVEDIDVV